MDIQSIKQRFGIIGHSKRLDRAIDVARQVAPTDITVLITGESGTGKEVFPKIIHHLSSRKHGPILQLTAGQYRKGLLILNYSDMKKALLQVLMTPERVILRW